MARRTSTAVCSPSASRSSVHSTAGRTWSGSSDAAPSDRNRGCSGIACPGCRRTPPAGAPRRRSATGSHEGGHVGNRVAHPEAGAAPLEVHGLVQVHRPGRVDCEERQLRHVVRREGGRRSRRLCFSQHVGRELSWQVELVADPREPGAQRPTGRYVLDPQREMTTRHLGRLRNHVAGRLGGGARVPRHRTAAAGRRR